ncbi:hypothetical protein M3Y98_00743900 [Aphelenchoides besseyi]|nr:hypothetical protein M3Y98_00743900 [Aphelenchoides besseyi]KAI6211484.1 hypothetical protein M3Y96_00439000 [Aphelenchoides besseyi]
MERSWFQIIFLCIVVIQLVASVLITQEEIDKNTAKITQKFITALCIIVVPNLAIFAALGWIIFSTRGYEKEALKLAEKLPTLRTECDELRLRYWRCLREERLYVQRNHEYDVLCNENRARAERIVEDIKAEIKEMRKEGKRGALRLNRLPYYEQEYEQLKFDAHDARAKALKAMNETMHGAEKKRRHEQDEEEKRAKRRQEMHKQQMANRQSYFKRAVGRAHHTQRESPFDEEATVGGQTTIARRKPQIETKHKDETQSPWEGNEASQLMKSKANKTETVAKSRKANDPFNNDD